MQMLRVDLQNCYGIKALKAEFDFSKGRAVAIYAPNGAMKSSFAETIRDISNGQPSRDRIFPKRATHRAITDEADAELAADSVVVLRHYDEVLGDGDKRELARLIETDFYGDK